MTGWSRAATRRWPGSRPRRARSPRTTSTSRHSGRSAAAVVDPEIRVVTIAELGILRDVAVDERGHVRVTITPTYSGCPAMDVIRADIRTSLGRAGYDDVEVVTALGAPWSTDWITEA